MPITRRTVFMIWGYSNETYNFAAATEKYLDIQFSYTLKWVFKLIVYLIIISDTENIEYLSVRMHPITYELCPNYRQRVPNFIFFREIHLTLYKKFLLITFSFLIS